MGHRSIFNKLISVLEKEERNVEAWVELAELQEELEGRSVGFHELATETTFSLPSFVWLKVLDLEPLHIQALEKVVEFYFEIADDMEEGLAYLQSLEEIAPKNLVAKMYRLLFWAYSDEADEEKAQILLGEILDADLGFAYTYGLFDYFEELGFLNDRKAALIAFAQSKQGGYASTLVERLEEEA